MSRKYPKPPGTADERRRLATLTHEQVAMILGITPNAVLETEARAIAKLKRHPLLAKHAADLGCFFANAPVSRDAP